MRVTIHERPSTERVGDRRLQGTRQNVYELKVELEGGNEHPYGERIEISYRGMFYRLEPSEGGLVVSVVGVPVGNLIVSPQSPNMITVSGCQEGHG